MELSVSDIFYSMSVIEEDAAKIWSSLVANYPTGHFDGVIEDMYLGDVAIELKKKIHFELELSLKNSQ